MGLTHTARSLNLTHHLGASHHFARQVRRDAPLVAVHDSARPLVTAADARRCFQDGLTVRDLSTCLGICGTRVPVSWVIYST